MNSEPGSISSSNTEEVSTSNESPDTHVSSNSQVASSAPANSTYSALFGVVKGKVVHPFKTRTKLINNPGSVPPVIPPVVTYRPSTPVSYGVPVSKFRYVKPGLDPAPTVTKIQTPTSLVYKKPHTSSDASQESQAKSNEPTLPVAKPAPKPLTELDKQKLELERKQLELNAVISELNKKKLIAAAVCKQNSYAYQNENLCIVNKYKKPTVITPANTPSPAALKQAATSAAPTIPLSSAPAGPPTSTIANVPPPNTHVPTHTNGTQEYTVPPGAQVPTVITSQLPPRLPGGPPPRMHLAHPPSHPHFMRPPPPQQFLHRPPMQQGGFSHPPPGGATVPHFPPRNRSRSFSPLLRRRHSYSRSRSRSPVRRFVRSPIRRSSRSPRRSPVRYRGRSMSRSRSRSPYNYNRPLGKRPRSSSRERNLFRYRKRRSLTPPSPRRRFVRRSRSPYPLPHPAHNTRRRTPPQKPMDITVTTKFTRLREDKSGDEHDDDDNIEERGKPGDEPVREKPAESEAVASSGEKPSGGEKPRDKLAVGLEEEEIDYEEEEEEEESEDVLNLEDDDDLEVMLKKMEEGLDDSLQKKQRVLGVRKLKERKKQLSSSEVKPDATADKPATQPAAADSKDLAPVPPKPDGKSTAELSRARSRSPVRRRRSPRYNSRGEPRDARRGGGGGFPRSFGPRVREHRSWGERYPRGGRDRQRYERDYRDGSRSPERKRDESEREARPRDETASVAGEGKPADAPKEENAERPAENRPENRDRPVNDNRRRYDERRDRFDDRFPDERNRFDGVDRFPEDRDRVDKERTERNDRLEKEKHPDDRNDRYRRRGGLAGRVGERDARSNLDARRPPKEKSPTPEPLDPVIAARKKKFQSTDPVEPTSKRIRLRHSPPPREERGEEEEALTPPGNPPIRDEYDEPLPAKTSKRIVLLTDGKKPLVPEDLHPLLERTTSQDNLDEPAPAQPDSLPSAYIEEVKEKKRKKKRRSTTTDEENVDDVFKELDAVLKDNFDDIKFNIDDDENIESDEDDDVKLPAAPKPKPASPRKKAPSPIPVLPSKESTGKTSKDEAPSVDAKASVRDKVYATEAQTTNRPPRKKIILEAESKDDRVSFKLKGTAMNSDPRVASKPDKSKEATKDDILRKTKKAIIKKKYSQESNVVEPLLPYEDEEEEADDLREQLSRRRAERAGTTTTGGTISPPPPSKSKSETPASRIVKSALLDMIKPKKSRNTSRKTSPVVDTLERKARQAAQDLKKMVQNQEHQESSRRVLIIKKNKKQESSDEDVASPVEDMSSEDERELRHVKKKKKKDKKAKKDVHLRIGNKKL